MLLDLSFLWLLIGLLVGLMANAARLRPALWRWWWLPGIGGVMALCGGWLGVFLLGRYFATAMALWIAVVSVMLLPWAIARSRRMWRHG